MIKARNANQKTIASLDKLTHFITLLKMVLESPIERLGYPSHDFDIDRVETRQSEIPCQEGWSFHFDMENPETNHRDHSC